MTELEDGFYWVRRGLNWEIARYYRQDEIFTSSGSGGYVQSGYFDEIDPRRIVREGVDK